jgi:transposase
MLGSYKARIDELLAENKTLPRKQRYTSRKIYEIIEAEGYQGSESGVRSYVAARREATRSKPAYLPLEFDPGQDAQMDWYEAQVWMVGEQITVQVFVMRLNYSRAKFVTPALAPQVQVWRFPSRSRKPSWKDMSRPSRSSAPCLTASPMIT